MPTKNPTHWFPSNRNGKYILVPNSLLKTNLGQLIVTNTNKIIETNSGSVVAQPATVWTPTAAS